MKHYSLEELLALNNDKLAKKVLELQDDLSRLKKYGLVWDREKIPEEVVAKCFQEIPVLDRDPSTSIFSTGTPTPTENIIIKGDNFHALSSLKLISPVEGFIDVIYIDPPYNTGNKDFVYNDNYVDQDDNFRHSKWLNFIEKRLTIALDILKEDGLVFISIDDNELADLVLLCNQIFGVDNLITVAPRVIKKGGKSTEMVAKNHDYLVIYCKNKSLVSLGKLEMDNNDPKLQKDEYFPERGPFRLNQCLDYDSLQYNESMDYEIDIDGEKFYPGGSKELWEKRHNGEHKKIDWVWRWSKPLFEWGLANGFVVFKDGKRRRIYTKTYANCKIEKQNGSYVTVRTENTKSYDSLFFTENKFSNDNAKKELDSFKLTKKFDYPKPTSLVKECLKIRNKKDSVVLDFFAGSGTTGQAVLDLNKEDGGNRTFILCTNNENNIFDEITIPRLKTVISGINPKKEYFHEGRNGNVHCFETSFVEKSASDDQSKFDLVSRVDGLLSIRESTFIKFKEHRLYNIFTNGQRKKYVFIFPNIPTREKMTDFISDIKKLDGEIILYMFSLSNEVEELKPLFSMEVLERISLKPIPTKIYEIYKSWIRNLRVED